MTIFLYLLMGLVVGILSGLVGTGGGVLLVPGLIWLFGFNHYKAIGTTLAVMVPPIGLMAAWEYYKREEVDLQAAIFIALAFVIGAWGGGKLADSKFLNLEFLRFLFGLMLLYVAVRFLLASDRDVAAAFFGILVVALGWLAYIGLRALGRRHRPPLSLAGQIQALHHLDHKGPDYII